MLPHIPFPALPVPPSWFPGHMLQFQRLLPSLLNKTDVVLELRDARLPLTSINHNFEGVLQKWQRERGVAPSSSPSQDGSTSSPVNGPVCERVVVFSKRDLVPEWGIKPFQRAMAAKYPNQRTFFASWNRTRDIRALNELLVNLGKEHSHQPELNVLVVGMPNVGKSTLLNALRSIGIAGPTAKALRTSAQPGLTRVLSTRLKLSVDPLVYAYDSPGVMLPFLGRGEAGAERGVKLALIAGIKEGMYDTEALAAYLLYRLNVLDPVAPAYLQLLPGDTPPGPLVDVHEFLTLLAQRLCMLKRGGVPDLARAAVWFIKWWREEGGRVSASAPALPSFSPSLDSPSPHPNSPTSPSLTSPTAEVCRRGWGFDLEWGVSAAEAAGGQYDEGVIQKKMEGCIDAFEHAARREEAEGGAVSSTQEKKRVKEQQRMRQLTRSKARLAARRGT